MTTALHPRTIADEPGADAPAPGRFRSIDTVRFLLDPRFRADPYPLYDRLRAHERVHHAAVAATLVSGYDECLTVLKDPHASSDESHTDLRFSAGRDGAGLLAEAPGRLIFRLATIRGRGEDSGAFLRAVARAADQPRPARPHQDPGAWPRGRSRRGRSTRCDPHIEAVAHRLLDGLEADGGAELLETYCYQLPVIVICEMLGVPAEDHARFGAWVPDIVAGLDAAAVTSGASGSGPTPPRSRSRPTCAS